MPNSFSFQSQSHPKQNSASADVKRPVLKVIGLGGGGQNAVDRMIELQIPGIDFIAANTDRQALNRSHAPVKIQLGPQWTRGFGAGGNPDNGERAAEESVAQLKAALSGADMVFLTAGMGGGTGTGSIPVAARVAREAGAVTIAIVTTPFGFEMQRRMNVARQGIQKLRANTDTLIVIPNDRLLQIAPANLSFEMAFRLADDILRQSIQGITSLIATPKFINVDFANVRNIMKLGGGALMCTGQANGENRLLKAVHRAITHPLLADASLENAAGILVNFTSGDDLPIFEIGEAMDYLHKHLGAPPETVFGVAYDERLRNRVEVILIATGMGGVSLEMAMPGFRSAAACAETAPAAVDSPASLLKMPDSEMAIAEAHPIEGHYPALDISDLDTPAYLRRG